MSKERLEEIKALHHLLTRNGYDLGVEMSPHLVIDDIKALEELE